jgi:hypothetical protein
VVLAFTVTAVGFAFDAGSGSRELGFVFSACYVLGCLLAVLAVRQSGLFTAVIQPPLLLFVTVPGAYFLFHGSEINGLKDLAINCGYPLIERFPLMFFTSAAILLIGMGRWYLGMSARHAAAAPATMERTTKERATKDRATKDKPKAAPAGGLVASLKNKMSGLIAAPPATDADPDAEPQARRRPAATHRQTGRRAGPFRPRERAWRRCAQTHQADRHHVAGAAQPPTGDRDHRTGCRQAAPPAHDAAHLGVPRTAPAVPCPAAPPSP